MTYLAFHNLWQQKFRLTLSIAGVALAMMLIIILNGFLSGIYVQVTAYLDNSPADLIVAQDGVTNLVGATSLLPSNTEDEVRSVGGIDQISPIVAQFVILDLHNQKVVSYMVGYDLDEGGGPWLLKTGREPADNDEVVLDWVMAGDHGFELGDEINILGAPFTVVGLSEGTNSWMASFFFIEKGAAEQLLLSPGATSFLLLTVEPGADVEAVEAILDGRLGGVEIVPAETIKQKDIELLVEIFAIPLRIMVAIAFTVGTAILGMVIYTATVEREKEYGVLKAVGAKNQQLYWLVAQQGLVTGLLGVILGIGMAWLAAYWIMNSWSKFLIIFQPITVLSASLTGLLMGLLAALLPARKVARLDPAEVFRR
ncbi:MAG TPA: ABC transporter permease [candidate division Zixibacteria bacterium]|nr:ABC transporter permease [candidate division Zixibacteria bacterium]